MLQDQEVQCLKVLDPMVFVPRGLQVMVNMTMDPMAMASNPTLLANHVFLLMVLDSNFITYLHSQNHQQTSFLGDNKQISNDFGTNNLIPYVQAVFA